MSPLPLSNIAITEKNKLNNADSQFILMLRADIPGVATPLRLAQNNADITWQGETWQAFPFDVREIRETEGERPRVDILIANASRQAELLLHEYDYYVKVNGNAPIVCYIYVVNTLNLASATPEVEHEFLLLQPRSSAEWVTFTLGASSPWNRRYPLRRMVPSCPWKFKQQQRVNGVNVGVCGYSGGETQCDKSIARCRVLNNEKRFGGYYATAITI